MLKNKKNHSMIIAIDIGGTKISAALMENGKVIKHRKVASIIHSDLTNLCHYLVELCQGWIEQAQQVAIACTGQVGQEYVNFLSAKKKLPLKTQLESAFKLPITILNDAAAAAWAEYCVDKNTNELAHSVINNSTTNKNDTLVYITVSTGIGGGVIQNGQLVTSHNGFCAHLGHVSVQNNNRQIITCHCGRINCVEAIASGTAIAQQASLILGKTVNAKEVFEQYLHVSEVAKLIDSASSAVCDLIASVKAMTGTEIIILGGSVGSSKAFHEQIIRKVSELPKIYQVRILSPKMGENADLVGAALYANMS